MHFSFDDGYSALVAWLKTLLPSRCAGPVVDDLSIFWKSGRDPILALCRT